MPFRIIYVKPYWRIFKMEQNFKALQGMLRKEETRLIGLEADKNQSRKEWVTSRDRVKDLRGLIQNFKNKKIIISDHARVRYLERILDFDFVAIDEEILAEKLHTIKKSNNVITTIISRRL